MFLRNLHAYEIRYFCLFLKQKSFQTDHHNLIGLRVRDLKTLKNLQNMLEWIFPEGVLAMLDMWNEGKWNKDKSWLYQRKFSKIIIFL